MPDISLTAETGRRPGSSDARRLRTSGKIPGVVYGHGQAPVPIAVNARELRAALTTDAGLNALLDLDVEGTPHLTLAREIQRHPVRNTVVHVDFLVVRRDEMITAEVHLTLTGDAVELHRGDGQVDQQLFTLEINATPGRIPNSIEVDISALAVGDTIRVGDLPLPEGVTTDVDPEAPVVVGQPPQVEVSADEATEGGAGAEGGEG
ncbi:MAG: 50S ribosomal protein L25 [Acidimicrobiales bacterium]